MPLMVKQAEQRMDEGIPQTRHSPVASAGGPPGELAAL